jgi:hypothetical protein
MHKKAVKNLVFENKTLQNNIKKQLDFIRAAFLINQKTKIKSKGLYI